MADEPPDPNGRDRQLVAGWQGCYDEDFVGGDISKPPYSRTVSETDNVWFPTVTMNPNPMHFLDPYAAETGFGARQINGTFVTALAVGMSAIDVTANATANLGYDAVRHHAPVYPGDTIFAESEVLSKRDSEAPPPVSLVEPEHRAFNQDDEQVLSLTRTPMVLKRDQAQPRVTRPPGRPEGVGTQPADLA